MECWTISDVQTSEFRKLLIQCNYLSHDCSTLRPFSKFRHLDWNSKSPSSIFSIGVCLFAFRRNLAVRYRKDGSLGMRKNKSYEVNRQKVDENDGYLQQFGNILA